MKKTNKTSRDYKKGVKHGYKTSKMEPLNDKREQLSTLHSGHYWEDDVKEKIQDTQKRLKNRMKKYYNKDENTLIISLSLFKNELNQIFKEEFGKELLK